MDYEDEEQQVPERRYQHHEYRHEKPIKVSQLVMDALDDLAETQGVSMKEIVKFLAYQLDMPHWKVARQVESALKKAVNFGLLTKERNLYHLQSFTESDGRRRRRRSSSRRRNSNRRNGRGTRRSRSRRSRRR